MDWLLAWILKKFLELIIDLLSLLENGITTLFSNAVFIGLVDVISYTAGFLFAIGFLINLFKLAEQSANGETPNIYAFAKNSILGISVLGGSKLLFYFFQKTNSISLLMISTVSKGIKNPDISKLYMGSPGFFFNMLAILITVAGIYAVYSTMSRVIDCIFYYCAIVLSVLGIAKGDSSLFATGLTKFLVMCLAHFIQMTLFWSMLASMIAAYGAGWDLARASASIFSAIVLAIGTIRAPKVLDTIFSTSLGGRGGGFSQASHSLMMLKNLRG